MKAKYKNAIRSKMLIRNALITLLNKKPLSDISVTDIVKFADINRGTFYNHYSNPLDILEEIKNELMEKLSVVLKNSKNTSSIDDLLDIINSYSSGIINKVLVWLLLGIYVIFLGYIIQTFFRKKK